MSLFFKQRQTLKKREKNVMSNTEEEYDETNIAGQLGAEITFRLRVQLEPIIFNIEYKFICKNILKLQQYSIYELINLKIY